MVNSDSEDQKIREWQKDVVKSIASDVSSTRDPPPARSIHAPARSELSQAQYHSNPVVVNQIVTSPPVVVTRIKAPEKPSDEISTKAIIGTVVGATAGAFIAYAMVKGDSENHQQPRIQERITYRTIEAPADHGVTHFEPQTRPAIQDTRSKGGYSRYEGRNLVGGPASTRIEAFHPSSEHAVRSDTKSYKVISRDGPIVMIDNEQDSRSRTSADRKTIRKMDLIPPHSSALGTEVRIARDVPLPTQSQGSRYSRASSATIKDQLKAPAVESRENALPSVAPQDSISQVSTKMSRGSKRSKQPHYPHRDRHSSDSRYEKVYDGDIGSKAGSKPKSKVGDMVDDVVSIIKDTSIKGSEHRR